METRPKGTLDFRPSLRETYLGYGLSQKLRCSLKVSIWNHFAPSEHILHAERRFLLPW